jgi:hypothetical protein
MKKIPLREKRAWLLRMEDEQWEPDRSDYYMMQLTNVVLALFDSDEDDLNRLVLRPKRKSGQDPTIKSSEYVAGRIAEAKRRAGVSE